MGFCKVFFTFCVVGIKVASIFVHKTVLPID